MKALTAFFLITLLPSVAMADEEKWSIAQADAVLVSDRRVAERRASPRKITDPKLVQEITDWILAAEGHWKKGFATSPSGDIRFIFHRGDQYLDTVGVGERFLVRGGGANWESKQISPELEARLRALSEKQPIPPP